MNGEVFLHHFTSPGGIEAVFNALTLEVCIRPGEPSPFDAGKLLGKYRDFCVSSGVTMATFFLTGRCPRKCCYCFVPPSMGSMTDGEVSNGLTIFAGQAGRGADILIYGGEPLLEPELVMRVIRESRDDLNLSLATGGWKHPRMLDEMLAERNGFAIVSIDGREKLHNSLRPLCGGNSFEEALKSFDAFRNAGCRVGISLTVTKGNASSVRDDFGFLLDTMKPDDIGLNIWMHPKPCGPENPFEARWEDVFDAVTGCLSDALSKGVYVEQLFRRLRPLVTASPRLRDCPSRGGRLVFTPGGGISPCDCMAAAGMYTVSDPESIPAILKRFSRLVPVFRDDCLTCPCVALCGGGCLYDSMVCTGSLSGVREQRCSFERALLSWMLGTILDGVAKGGASGVLSPVDMQAFLPVGILDRERMPQPEAMLGGELR